MTYKLHFKLPGLPKTTNSKSAKQHWSHRKREADLWKQQVYWETLRLRPKKPLTKAKITLIRHSASEPDFDGLVSSFKHVLDGLTYGKIIIDDKYSVIGQPVYKWEKAPPKKGFIEVYVESIQQE